VADAPSGAPEPSEETAETVDVTAVDDDRTEPAGSADAGWRFLREFGLLTLSALVIAILIKTLLVQAFYIPSASMEPTLMPGDRILVNRLAYRFGHIERGDIIVFGDPTPTAEHRGLLGGIVHWLGEGIGVVRPANDDFIKRVIALPGETWEIRDGVTYVNGERLDEPYLNQAEPDTRSFGPQTVPDGMLFVMGDNRLHSGDSRFPPPGGLGYIPIDKVIGQAFVIIYPPSRMGWLH
jgi:signal peptidase I